MYVYIFIYTLQYTCTCIPYQYDSVSGHYPPGIPLPSPYLCTKYLLSACYLLPMHSMGTYLYASCIPTQLPANFLATSSLDCVLAPYQLCVNLHATSNLTANYTAVIPAAQHLHYQTANWLVYLLYQYTSNSTNIHPICIHWLASVPTIPIYIHTYIHTYIHCITLHYVTLHYIALHYITLHTYITDRQTNSQPARQTDRQTDIHYRQTYIHTKHT